MIRFTNYELCQKCGGKCCKSDGCIYAPEDFEEITFNSLVKLYQNGEIMFFPIIDEWTNRLEGWILKTPQEECEKIPRDFPIKKGTCVFLREDYCKFEYRMRPRGGKLIIPGGLNGDGICDAIYDERTAFEDWKPYMNLVEDVVFYLLSLERDEETYDHLQCQVCGGKCCKNSGCYFAPSDFRNMSFERMKKILSKGFISIVWIGKEHTGLDTDVLALKMRNKYAAVYDQETYKKNGGCILLESTGCVFEDEDRPYGGKALVPERLYGRNCSKGYSMRQCAEEWMAYQELLKRLLTEFDGKEVTFTGIC